MRRPRQIQAQDADDDVANQVGDLFQAIRFGQRRERDRRNSDGSTNFLVPSQCVSAQSRWPCDRFPRAR